ncbi:MAG: hypothetical protein OEZ43_14880 [Gammaproteobacteria bacterium]|nr:hypothetical protein [Gammaproteobacteria bacterium]
MYNVDNKILVVERINSTPGLEFEFSDDNRQLASSNQSTDKSFSPESYPGVIRSQDGFFEQKALLRILSSNEAQYIGLFDRQDLFLRQINASVSTKELKKYPSLHLVQSASEITTLQFVENPNNRFDEFSQILPNLTFSERVSLVQRLAVFTATLLDHVKIEPSGIEISNYFSRRNGERQTVDNIRITPFVNRQDMYTDKDLVDLFHNIAVLMTTGLFTRQCDMSETARKFKAMLHQIPTQYDLSAISGEGLKNIVHQETLRSQMFEPTSSKLYAMCLVMRLAITMEDWSYFNGKRGISDALRTFAGELKDLSLQPEDDIRAERIHQSKDKNMELIKGKGMTNQELISLLSEFVEDREWLESAIGVKDSSGREKENIPGLEKEYELIPQLDDTVVIAGKPLKKNKSVEKPQLSIVEETLIIK